MTEVKPGEWVGVDLDKTLAHYEPGMAERGEIGEPLRPMVNRIKRHLRAGHEVRIMTARVNEVPGWDHEFQRRLIEVWTESVFGVRLKVTCQKDFRMAIMYDDRAIRVEKNTGRVRP